MNEHMIELLEMLETLCDGLEWNIENHPTVMNEADAEALDLARALIARVKASPEYEKYRHGMR